VGSTSAPEDEVDDSSDVQQNSENMNRLSKTSKDTSKDSAEDPILKEVNTKGKEHDTKVH